MTLFEMVKVSKEDFDISDTIYDWLNYFTCDTSEQEQNDNYEKAMTYFAKHIEVESQNTAWGSLTVICKITDFLKKHQKAFDKFCNTHNKEEFTPKYYKKQYGKIDGEDYYYIYFTTFQCLINGNYCESDYKELLELLEK